MAIATDQQAGAVVTDTVRAGIYGAKLPVCYTLPEDVLAIYGDFGMGTAMGGVKPQGIEIAKHRPSH